MRAWRWPFAWLVAASVAFGQTAPVITTAAGSDFVFRGEGRPAAEAQLGFVQDVAVDRQGNVFIADPGNALVLKATPQGRVSVVAGNGIRGYAGDGGPATRAALSFPQALAVAADGTLYIGDGLDAVVRKVTPDGTITTLTGNGTRFRNDIPASEAGLFSVSGLAVDAAGNVYVSDADDHVVHRIGTDGIIRAFAGTGVDGYDGDNGPAVDADLNLPQRIAVDADGNVLIADMGNQRVRRVSRQGIITTVAGNGLPRDSGDGQAAVRAGVAFPSGVYADPGGSIFIMEIGGRLREVTGNGLIRTVGGAGATGFGIFGGSFGGDGGPPLRAQFNSPLAIAGDGAGTLYIADSLNNRVRRIAQNVITTFAGSGRYRVGGDGGPATAAGIGTPGGVAADGRGNLYIADALNHQVRRVRPNGVIETFAGTGTSGYSGDNGPAREARLNVPLSLAVDRQDNVYIADVSNYAIRKVSPDGTIRTVAGGVPLDENSQEPDDGSDATRAVMVPTSLAVDAGGNLYIGDPLLCVISKVTPDGKIFRLAGVYGLCLFADEDVQARDTTIDLSENFASAVAVDAAGNVYFSELTEGRVMRIAPDGRVTAFAGGGFAVPQDGRVATTVSLDPQAVAAGPGGVVYISDFKTVYAVRDGRIFRLAGNPVAVNLGDGGPAAQASLGEEVPGLAVDAAGNVFLGDADNGRVRAVLGLPPAVTVAPQAIRFEAPSRGAVPPPQNVSVLGAVPGVGFTVETATARGGNWLAAGSGGGSTPRVLEVTIDPANLDPGTYEGTITITAPTGMPARTTVAVTAVILPGVPPRLEVDKQSLSFAFPRNAVPRSQAVMVSNAGGGTVEFTAAAQTNAGGAWLSVDPANGTAQPARPATVAVTATPGSLAAGTYTGRVTIRAGAEVRSVAVTMTISANDRAILLSQSGLAFTAVAGGGVIPPRTFEVLNIGRGTVAWQVTTSTLDGGPGWLTATPGAGSTNAAATVPGVEVRVNQAGLAPGAYYGLVRVDAPDAANSPQVATVFLEVLPPGSDPGPLVEPSELLFTGVAGGPSPSSRDVLVYNIAAAPKTFRSSTSLGDSAVGQRVANLPTDMTLDVDRPNRVVIQPFVGNLPAGVHRGTLSLQFSDGRVRPVGVKLILTPAEGAGRTADACTPTRLAPAITSLSRSAPITVGWPVPVTAEVRDDCGNPHESGSVVVSFSNGDAPLALTSLRDGRWAGTWPSKGAGGTETTLKVEASNPAMQLRGEESLVVGIRARQEPPSLEAAGVVSAAGPPQSFVPLAPGSMVSIYGERLAEATLGASALPLPRRIGSTRLVMGGIDLPLLFVSPTQVNALVPAGLAPNTPHQLLVQRANTYARPVQVDVAPAHPAVFVNAQAGPLQGHIYYVRGTESSLAGRATPARAGDVLVMYAAGLGATNPGVEDGATAAGAPPATTTEQVRVTIGGVEAPVDFAGLAPGFAGLYQVNLRLPAGVGAGDEVPVVVTVAGQSSAAVTMAVR